MFFRDWSSIAFSELPTHCAVLTRLDMNHVTNALVQVQFLDCTYYTILLHAYATGVCTNAFL